MNSANMSDDAADVFRDSMKERRESYYVIYQPADSRYPVAHLNLVYPDGTPHRDSIVEHMTKEMTNWLERFPVPIMVSAFDAADNFLQVCEKTAESYLVGYFDVVTSRVASRWGSFSDGELPIDQSRPQYLSRAYSGVPFRLKVAVQMEANEKAAHLKRGLRLFRIASVFWVGIPLTIEIISLGINWIGYALWSISVSIGLFKFARTLGWIKPSKRQLAKDEEMRKMKHYYYHCERNPAGFERLKSENFDCDVVAETQQEFNSIPLPKKAAS